MNELSSYQYEAYVAYVLRLSYTYMNEFFRIIAEKFHINNKSNIRMMNMFIINFYKMNAINI